MGWYRTERRYQAAVQLADRLDPGWRAGVPSYSTDPIPDHENSAILVDSAAEKLPRGWSALRGDWPPIIINPGEPLPSELFEEFVHSRATRPARPSPRRCPCPSVPGAGLPTGILMCLAGYRRPGKRVETVSGLLYLDGLIRIEERDFTGAVKDLRAMINAGRSLDDTPSLAVQAGRVNAVVPAVATLERLLARGQLPSPVLADLQKLMEDEIHTSLSSHLLAR